MVVRTVTGARVPERRVLPALAFVACLAMAISAAQGQAGGPSAADLKFLHP